MISSYSIADFLNSADTELNFHINRLEEMPPLPTHIESPHKHLFYEVVLIKKGNTIQNIDYQVYKISSSAFFFVSQGQLHLWGKDDRETIEGYRLMFTEDFFLSNHIDKSFLFELMFLDNIYFNPCLSLSASAIQPIYTYFDLMFQEYTRSGANPKALQSLLFLALTEIQRVAVPSSTKVLHKEIMVYKSFLELLETHLTEQLPVSAYADRLCMTPKQLNKSVQIVVNQSVSDVIKHRLVLESKRLLAYSNLNINQTAYALGFADSAYFARFFRKETNISPTEFKTTMADMYRKTA
jgi:AraC family transcriptional regulator, transcriptional activator of pobA